MSLDLEAIRKRALQDELTSTEVLWLIDEIKHQRQSYAELNDGFKEYVLSVKDDRELLVGEIDRQGQLLAKYRAELERFDGQSWEDLTDERNALRAELDELRGAL